MSAVRARPPSAGRPEPAQREVDVTVRTYRYLRLAVVVVVVALALSVALQTVHAGCQLGSVSAYYFTPSRSVFVGSLSVIGALMIIYQGDPTTEDHTLNFAGFMALALAWVPPRADGRCGRSSFSLSAADRADVVRNNFLTLLIVVALAVVVQLIFRRRQTVFDPAWWIGVMLGAAYGLIFAIKPRWFELNGHVVAAVSLFAAMVIVVFANAYSFDRLHQQGSARFTVMGRPLPTANRYSVIAALMVASFVVIPGVHSVVAGWYTWVFWLEAALIIEFALFWAIQTQELWNDGLRSLAAQMVVSDHRLGNDARPDSPGSGSVAGLTISGSGRPTSSESLSE